MGYTYFSEERRKGAILLFNITRTFYHESTCSISYGVNLYLDLQDITKIQFNSIQFK
jgi:hypothetical protein